MTEVIKFEKKRQWMIAGKKVDVNKIETTSYNTTNHKSRVRYEDLDPTQALKNVISNVGQLQTGTFLEQDKDTVIARINDMIGNTLIRTNWQINRKVFNEIVVNLQVEKNLPEHLFYVVSKIS